MTLVRRRFLSLAAATVGASVVARAASAQSYPARLVRVIVPYGAGGPTDVFARLVALKMSEQLGRQFYVENIGGASGNIGIGRGAKSPADGYTVLVVPTNFVVNPALYDKVPYDPATDFDAVSLAVTSPMVISVNPALPAQTVNDLIALIKANPGKYSYASGGTGSPGHLVGEQFRLVLGLDLIHVPFNSAGLAVGSAIGGHTPICIVSPAPTVPQVQEGKLRALAVTRKIRSKALPDVPTMAEAGHPDISGENWFAFIVPAGTPRDIVGLLHREIVRIVALPDVQERLAALGFESVANTPEECAAQIRAEIVKWARVIREANIKVQ